MNPENVVEGFDEAITGFLKVIEDDPRIGPVHISLFMAILNAYKAQDMKIPISIFSRDLMKVAKISAGATFRKCIWDLHELGLIKYVPSFNPLLGSLIYILKLEQ